MATLGEFARIMEYRIELNQMQGLESTKKAEITLCLKNVELNLLNWSDSNGSDFFERNLLDLRSYAMTTVDNFIEDLYLVISSLADFQPVGILTEQALSNRFKEVILTNLKSILGILQPGTKE